MGFLEKIKPPVRMEIVNLAYKKLRPLQIAYIIEERSGNENEIQQKSLKYEQKKQRVISELKLKNCEIKKLNEMLFEVWKENPEDKTK